MKSQRADTIAAIITPLGEGGIGVIRVTGPQAIPIAERIFRPTRPRDLSAVPDGRLCHGFVHDENGPIDEAILRACPRNKLVEINCHGGIAAVRKVFDLARRAGARAASPEDILMESAPRDRIRREALGLLPQALTPLTVRMLLAQYNGALSARLTELAQETDPDTMRKALDALLATADFGTLLQNSASSGFTGRRAQAAAQAPIVFALSSAK